jgi:hemerythrin-like metal-binding protein
MRWTPALETGNVAVDAEHRELIALIDELELADVGADETRVPDALDQLTDYIAIHFQMEEKLMRREGYPAEAIEHHLAEHRELALKTQGFVDAYAEGSLTSVEPIVEFLYEWFSHHILEVDTLMAEHVRARHAAS